MEKQKIKKVTVRFSKKLKCEMHETVISQGYGLHGKSKWLAEAIEKFSNQSNYIELVEHGISINQSDLCEVEAFYLKETTLIELKTALLRVREKYPLFEGVQSAFIRACVVYQLMWQFKFPPGRK
jgi:hypothetical protein